jgi:hypothetical protein
MGGHALDADEGTGMTDEDSLLTNPPNPDAAWHVQDYLRFTSLLKWGAAGAFVTALIVLMIL